MSIYLEHNFINNELSNKLMDYTENNIDKFSTGKHRRYFTLAFGKDHYHSDSKHELAGIDEIKPDILPIFDRILEYVNDKYSPESEIYVASFWMVKQKAGAKLLLHSDTDNGANPHVKYSAAIYLSDVTEGGQINFPNINFSHQPKSGDFLIWPSHGREFDHEVLDILHDRYSILFFLTDDIEYKLKH
jgi:hypothetical protein